MLLQSGRCFCNNCKKQTNFERKDEVLTKKIDGKDYPITISVAYCKKCHSYVYPPGLFHQNIEELQKQYRELGLV